MKDSTQLIHMKRISPSSVHWRRITKTHSSSRWNAISGFSAMSGIKCGAGSAVADLMVPPDGGRRITPQNDFESGELCRPVSTLLRSNKGQTTKTSIQDSTEWKPTTYQRFAAMSVTSCNAKRSSRFAGRISTIIYSHKSSTGNRHVESSWATGGPAQQQQLTFHPASLPTSHDK